MCRSFFLQYNNYNLKVYTILKISKIKNISNTKMNHSGILWLIFTSKWKVCYTPFQSGESWLAYRVPLFKLSQPEFVANNSTPLFRTVLTKHSRFVTTTNVRCRALPSGPTGQKTLLVTQKHIIWNKHVEICMRT